MKKIVSLVLASALFASALASCALSPASSSSALPDGSPAALYTRLSGKSPDNITFACGEDAEKYADLSSLRDDGYILRRDGSDTVVLAKTDDGLDRGVRYLANKAPEDGDFARTYGEGYRVKKLTVAGRDIAEYVIVMANCRDKCHEFAAAELQRFIRDACGAELDIVDTAGAHSIVLEQVTADDPRYADLGDEGFTLRVDENGDLYIIGGELRGCLYGVYELAERIGWRFHYDYDTADDFAFTDYNDGMIDYLYEADAVDIPAGLDETQTPAIANRGSGYLNCTNEYEVKLKANVHIKGLGKYNGYRIYDVAHHAGYFKQLEDYGVYWDGTAQPCFTDPDVIQCATDWFCSVIDGKIAAGYTVGYDLCDMYLGQADMTSFCDCKRCRELIKKDGGNSGPMLYLTNAVAEVAAEKYPGLYVNAFAYWGTTSPPKVSRPLPNVAISYCYYNDIGKLACMNHPMDGEDCVGFNTTTPYSTVCGNDLYTSELRGWCDICDRVGIWLYPGIWYDFAYPSDLVKNLREDMQFFAELGVYQLYDCTSGQVTRSGYLVECEYIYRYMFHKLMWDPYITDAELEQMMLDWFYIEYGDGAQQIYDYYKLMDYTAVKRCWCANGFFNPADRIDFDKVAEVFDYEVLLFDEARQLANTAKQEKGVLHLAAGMYMAGLTAVHTDWYLNGDAQSKAKYEDYFGRFRWIVDNVGFAPDQDSSRRIYLDLTDFDISQNLGSLMKHDTEWWK